MISTHFHIPVILLVYNNSCHKQELYSFRIKDFAEFVDKVGKPYMWAQRICGLDFLPEEIHVRGFFDLFNIHRLLFQFSFYDTKGMSFAFVLQIF